MKDSRFKVTYHGTIKPRDATKDLRAQALDMTAQINAAFESWIRERPDQWYCSKRRWARRAHLEAARKAG